MSNEGIEGYVFDGADDSQMAFWRADVDAETAEHIHPFDEWFLVVEGTYTIILDGNEVRVDAGQEYFIPKGTRITGRVTARTRTIHAFGGRRAKRKSEEPTSLPAGVVNETNHERPVTKVSRGDLVWIAPDDSRGPAPDYSHPHVVIQDDVLNHSRIATTVVCALTSNLHRATEPGNVLLDVGEGSLPKQSVVVVSQVSSIEKSRLGERIGSLSETRIEQI